MKKTPDIIATANSVQHLPNMSFLEVHPVDVLSFGPDTQPIALGPLNVLIGPNGSGKSNLIDLNALTFSCAGDMRDVFVRGGSIRVDL